MAQISRPNTTDSPKRKRGAVGSIEHSPQVSPRSSRIISNTSGLSFLFDPNNQDRSSGDVSPSSSMAGHLELLNLQSNSGMPVTFIEAGHSRKRFAQSGEAAFLRDDAAQSAEMITSTIETQSQSKSPSPSSSSLNLESPQALSNIMERPRSHRRSPPLDGDPEENPLSWHQSEITGHNPTDPNDDGYGINGIGFRPTAAIAWARSQRRRQQLIDYRNREAREARQRRIERRTEEIRDLSGRREKPAKKKGAKVRFEAMDIVE